MQQLNNLKIALVHDFLTQYGGAEKVLEALCEMFPEAPIYTLLYDKDKMRGKFENKDIHTSFLQKFPKFLRNNQRYLLPFLPTAPETFDLRDFDLIISSSGAWSKGIVTKLDTIHIAYLHSPMRYAWDHNERYVKEINKQRLNLFIRPVLNYIRMWDRQAADRPDYLVANSKYTQIRLRKYYRRDSQVIYPPAVLSEQQGPPAASELGVENNYFLVVSRLLPYKKVDLVIDTFNKLGLPLVIIGEGKQKKYLQKIAGENIKILGWQDEEKVQQYYANARAFIFPAEDDFGITMVEAINYGIPVIALRKGGALEIVQEGITGELFDTQNPAALADGVRRFIENEKSYDKNAMVNKAKEFSQEIFKEKFLEYIKLTLDKN